MTKQEILRMTGLSEAEFYKKYPTQKSWEKAMKKMQKGGDPEQYPTQPTPEQIFHYGTAHFSGIPMMAYGGDPTQYPTQPTPEQIFTNPKSAPALSFYKKGGQPCYECGGQMRLRKRQQGGPADQEQLVQIIEMYSQMVGQSPEDVISQLQGMEVQQQQEALQQMVQAIQEQQMAGSEQSMQNMQQQMMPEEQMMAAQQMQGMAEAEGQPMMQDGGSIIPNESFSDNRRNTFANWLASTANRKMQEEAIMPDLTAEDQGMMKKGGMLKKMQRAGQSPFMQAFATPANQFPPTAVPANKVAYDQNVVNSILARLDPRYGQGFGVYDTPANLQNRMDEQIRLENELAANKEEKRKASKYRTSGADSSKGSGTSTPGTTTGSTSGTTAGTTAGTTTAGTTTTDGTKKDDQGYRVYSSDKDKGTTTGTTTTGTTTTAGTTTQQQQVPQGYNDFFGIGSLINSLFYDPYYAGKINVKVNDPGVAGSGQMPMILPDQSGRMDVRYRNPIWGTDAAGRPFMKRAIWENIAFGNDPSRSGLANRVTANQVSQPTAASQISPTPTATPVVYGPQNQAPANETQEQKFERWLKYGKTDQEQIDYMNDDKTGYDYEMWRMNRIKNMPVANTNTASTFYGLTPAEEADLEEAAAAFNKYKKRVKKAYGGGLNKFQSYGQYTSGYDPFGFGDNNATTYFGTNNPNTVYLDGSVNLPSSGGVSGFTGYEPSVPSGITIPEQPQTYTMDPEQNTTPLDEKGNLKQPKYTYNGPSGTTSGDVRQKRLTRPELWLGVTDFAAMIGRNKDLAANEQRIRRDLRSLYNRPEAAQQTKNRGDWFSGPGLGYGSFRLPDQSISAGTGAYAFAQLGMEIKSTPHPLTEQFIKKFISQGGQVEL